MATAAPWRSRARGCKWSDPTSRIVLRVNPEVPSLLPQLEPALVPDSGLLNVHTAGAVSGGGYAHDAGVEASSITLSASSFEGCDLPSNSSGKCSYERPTRGTVCGTMRSMCGADAGCLAINYQSLRPPRPTRPFPNLPTTCHVPRPSTPIPCFLASTDLETARSCVQMRGWWGRGLCEDHVRCISRDRLRVSRQPGRRERRCRQRVCLLCLLLLKVQSSLAEAPGVVCGVRV